MYDAIRLTNSDRKEERRNKSHSLCVEYRKLNKVTLGDPEPMTIAEDLFQGLGKNK